MQAKSSISVRREDGVAAVCVTSENIEGTSASEHQAWYPNRLPLFWFLLVAPAGTAMVRCGYLSMLTVA